MATRQTRLHVRITDLDAAELRAAAYREGVPVSEVVRRGALAYARAAVENHPKPPAETSRP